MEIATLGLALYVGKQLLPKGAEKATPDDCEESVHPEGFQDPKDFLMKEYRRGGMIAPLQMHVHNRMPFRVDQPPYDIFKGVNAEARKNPSDKMYQYAVNAQDHYRKDFERTLDAGVEYYMPKRGGAIVTTFTRELCNPANPSMRTGLINHSWVPPNPTDADWQRAGALARTLPRDPTLFAPSADFMNAPGLPFRYSN